MVSKHLKPTDSNNCFNSDSFPFHFEDGSQINI